MRRMTKLGLFLLFVFVVGGVIFYFKKDGYQVSFNSNGGSIVSPIQTGFDGNVLKPEDPIREGYVFLGWYFGEKKFDFDTKIKENITLTAFWEEEKDVTYTLSFDSLGGSEIDPIVVLEGEILVDFPQPIKENYEFIAWYYHNQEFDFQKPIVKDYIFVAKYQYVGKDEDIVSITFDSNGGSEVDSITVLSGSLPKMPKQPIREGYVFMGWTLDDQEFDFSQPVFSDITLKALWQKE